MGATVCQAVADAADMELVAAVDPQHAGETVCGTTLTADTEAMGAAEVAVDFTLLDVARRNLQWCREHGVHAVVGTSGFSDQELAELAPARQSHRNGL